MLPKVIVAAVWILSIAAWFVPWTGFLMAIIRWTWLFMGGAHVIEFIVYREIFERSGGSTVSHFLNTLIFGVFHINPLKEALAAGSEPVE